MNEILLKDLKDFDASLVLLYRQKDFEKVETELRRLFALAIDSDERCRVLGMMVNHYHFVENDALAESALRKMIEISPKNLDAWLGLSEHFHYHEIDLENAEKAIDIALRYAILENEKVRQVLGVRIRIAQEKNDNTRLQESFLMLLAYELPVGKLDVALESDFLSKIPPGAIDDDLLSCYKELSQKKSPH